MPINIAREYVQSLHAHFIDNDNLYHFNSFCKKTSVKCPSRHGGNEVSSVACVCGGVCVCVCGCAGESGEGESM